MNLLTIENLSKQFSERLLFDNVNLLINTGDRIGIIGINGSGKSTLLRIVAGLEAPDSGDVTVWGGVRVEYLPQEPLLDDRLTVLEQLFRSDSPQMCLLRDYEQAADALQRNPQDALLQARLAALSAEMDRTGGWAAEANAKAVLTQLGISNFEAGIAALSGGQRKRVALARAFIDRADLLLLDEPTNHIDAATIAWLEEYLATTPGALLMVTHDRYFLDRVVNRIVELDRRQLVSYPGNYTRYLEAREQRHQRLAEAEQKRQKLLQRELEWLRRTPMARGTKQKARKERVADLLQIRHDRGEETVSMALASRRLGKQVLHARNLSKQYGEQRAVDGVDLDLEPGDRIGIIGPNGAGKSTLLDILASKITPDAGALRWGDTVQVGYYDQRNEGLKDHLRLIELIENEAPLILTKSGERVEAAQMLEWFLFPRPMQWARIGSLSGGERRRLYLLRTLVHRPNVLFFDEPTNDLDIQTLTVLEEFLDHFNGCLVVVSHDRYFLDRTVDFLIGMEAGRLGPRYPTPYTTYARLRQQAAATLAAETEIAEPSEIASDRAPRSNRARKLTWKEQKELEALEAHIHDLEKGKAELLDALNRGGEDYVKLQALAAQLKIIESSLETAMERWLKLAEIGETAA
jgi:ATP-binding cassette subfamily F protein uup